MDKKITELRANGQSEKDKKTPPSVAAGEKKNADTAAPVLHLRHPHQVAQLTRAAFSIGFSLFCAFILLL